MVAAKKISYVVTSLQFMPFLINAILQFVALPNCTHFVFVGLPTSLTIYYCVMTVFGTNKWLEYN